MLWETEVNIYFNILNELLTTMYYLFKTKTRAW